MRSETAEQMDLAQGLRVIEAIETGKGVAYEALGEQCSGDPHAAALLGRLHLNQASRRNVIRYQARVTSRNRRAFDGLRLPRPPLDRLRELVDDLVRTGPHRRLGESLDAAREIECQSLLLYDRFQGGPFADQFGPFLGSLCTGSARHIELLDSLAAAAPRPGDPVTCE